MFLSIRSFLQSTHFHSMFSFSQFSMRKLLHRQHGSDHESELSSVVSGQNFLPVGGSCQAWQKDPVRVHRFGCQLIGFKLSARLSDGNEKPLLVNNTDLQILLFCQFLLFFVDTLDNYNSIQLQQFLLQRYFIPTKNGISNTVTDSETGGHLIEFHLIESLDRKFLII